MADKPNQTENEKETSITGDGNVVGDHNIVTVTKISPLAQLTSLHQIRAPPGDFIGRDDEIRRILTEFDKGAAIVGLFGMGGVGKTDLALVLAEKLKNRLAYAQFFIDMRGTSKPVKTSYEAMAHIIRSFDPTAHLAESQDELQCQYNSVLDNKKALILLDNAAGREQVEPLLPPPNCCMLITSRHKFALKGLKAIDLNVLSPKDARSLLLANSERISEGADELANLCGYLPLALRNAAYVLAERVDLDVTEYVNRLKDARKRLDLVDASFDLSYNLLTPDLREKWPMLSIFPADFDRAGGAGVLNIGLNTAIDDLGELVRWSLVNFYPSATPAESRYRLHDLARIYANSRLNPSTRSAAQQRHAKYYKDAASKFKNDFNNLEQDQENILTGMEWAFKKMETSREKKELALLVLSFMDAIANYLDTRGNWTEYHRRLQQAIDAGLQIGDEKITSDWKIALGALERKKGNHKEALRYLNESLEIKETLGDKRGISRVLLEMGNLAWNANKSEACEYFRRVLKIEQELDNWEGISQIQEQLGLLAEDMRNNGEASKYYNLSLAIGKEMNNTSIIFNGLFRLGYLAFLNKDYDNALKLTEECLEIAEKLEDKRRTSSSLQQLGIVAQAIGKYNEAYNYYQRSLTIEQELGNMREISIRFSYLGQLAMISSRNYDEAEKFYKKSLEIKEKMGQKSGMARVILQLGQNAQEAGKTDEAETHYKDSLDIFKFLDDKRGISSSLRGLGSLAESACKYDKARELYFDSIEINKDQEDKSEIYKTFDRLIGIAQKTCNYDDVNRLIKQRSEIIEHSDKLRDLNH